MQVWRYQKGCDAVTELLWEAGASVCLSKWHQAVGSGKTPSKAFQSMDFDGLTQASFASGLALIAQL